MFGSILKRRCIRVPFPVSSAVAQGGTQIFVAREKSARSIDGSLRRSFSES
jgi:hypothetical protein